MQRERLPWLGRLAKLADRWKVVITQGVYGDDYRQLLARSQIVFNRSIRGECNKRAFEAAIAGALLFQEADNREVGDYFRPAHSPLSTLAVATSGSLVGPASETLAATPECLVYQDDDMEARLEYYLEHEGERRAIAEAGQRRARECSFEKLWERQLAAIEADWPMLLERAKKRCAGNRQPNLHARLWQALSATQSVDTALVGDVARELVAEPQSASLHQALGLATAVAEQGRVPVADLAGKVAGYFQRALACEPSDLMAGLNLAESLALSGQQAAAIAEAERILIAVTHAGRADTPVCCAALTVCSAQQTKVSALPNTWSDVGHFPLGFDLFRVEWERCAWNHAGSRAAEEQGKRNLIRWRLHSLLATLTGRAYHYYEAAVALPDLPVTRAALGCALARAGQLSEATAHLRYAVGQNPFDLEAARALFQVLTDSQDEVGERRFAADRRLLAKAAPRAVPAEDWFMTCRPAGDELASIMILCCNELEYTKLCLESVQRHTRRPYELVIVDNGSTDGTLVATRMAICWPGRSANELRLPTAADCRRLQ